jgi:hypothetical protein
MNWLDDRGRLFGRISVIDLLLIGVVVLTLLGVMLVRSRLHMTSGTQVERIAPIYITVQIPNLKTLDPQMFKTGDHTSVTIRNQPRGDVRLVNVTMQPVHVTFAGPNGKPYRVPDLAQEHGYDYTLVLEDMAHVTKTGYVTEGVKVKVGLPIELEGFRYRVYGKIINVQERPATL